MIGADGGDTLAATAELEGTSRDEADEVKRLILLASFLLALPLAHAVVTERTDHSRVCFTTTV
jgi:hypothetical protein